MKARSGWMFFLFLAVVVGFGASRLFLHDSSASAAQKAPAATPAAQQGAVERGKYLVENVAMCEECHTPRDASGELDETRRLQGAPIWIAPVRPNPDWAMNAPALAGFAGYTDEQGAQILERGVGPNGLAIRKPMHIYHMNHADALAIMAYLRSLPAAYPQQ
jgi:hypothetical protein